MITFTSLHITAFGGIRERRIELTDGLNLLRGDNESGKSTTLAFLRWVLYGYSSLAEKKRLQPLDGSLPSGTLTLCRDGESFSIRRITTQSGREKARITRLSDQRELDFDGEPGEYFFSLPSDAFDQTALIRQIDGATVDGKKMSEAMNNILFSADESISVENALKRLGQARISLWHLNRKGGRIAEDTERLQELRSRLTEAQGSGEEIGELETALNDKKKRLSSHKEQAEHFRRLLLSYAVFKRREKEALLAEREVLWKQSEQALRDVRDNGIGRGYVPDSAFREAMLQADRALRTADNRITLTEAELALAEKPSGSPEEGMMARFDARGGMEQTIADCRDALKKSRTYTILGFLLLLPLIGILFLILASRSKKRARSILQEFSCSSLSALEELAAQCTSRTRLSRERIAEIQARLTALKVERRTLGEQADSLASRTGECFDTALTALAEYEQALNHLSAKAMEARAAYESTKTLLDGEKAPCEEDESTLPPLPDPFDPNDANRKYRFYSEQIPLLEKQIHQHQLRLTELNATREDPCALADRIAEEEASLRTLHAEYDALELAISALTDASATLRDTLSDSLAARAADYLSRMTDGRYPTLGVDADLQIHTPHPDQSDISVSPLHLSEGTKAQAYLALRLALTEALCPNSPPPLLLDEALVFLDDRRLSRVLALFRDLASERQILLFTASGREEAALARIH